MIYIISFYKNLQMKFYQLSAVPRLKPPSLRRGRNTKRRIFLESATKRLSAATRNISFLSGQEREEWMVSIEYRVHFSKY